MSKDLIIIQKVDAIEKQIQKPRSPALFPIQFKHREELRDLKNGQLGSLRGRLNNIRKLKYEEYLKANITKRKKKAEQTRKQIKLYTNKHEKLYQSMRNTIQNMKENKTAIEEEFGLYTTIHVGWDLKTLLGKPRQDKEDELVITFNDKKFNENFLKKEFEQKFGNAFQLADDRIKSLEEKFEESILFGDLETVKQLYYIMKDADKFLDKVSKIDVTIKIKR